MEASAQVRFIQNGGREFLTDEPISLHTYEEEKIDIHHIFPQKWCKDNEIERKRMDCIVNKAAISSRTNRIIGGVAPSKYLRSLEKRGEIGTSISSGSRLAQRLQSSSRDRGEFHDSGSCPDHYGQRKTVPRSRSSGSRTTRVGNQRCRVSLG